MTKKNMQVDPRLFFSLNQQLVGGHEKIQLLEAIESCGSITQAAKVLGISYKNAWDTIARINDYAQEPVVNRVKGGKGGGLSCLSDYGRHLVQQYYQLEKMQMEFMNYVQKQLDNESANVNVLSKVYLKTSARNHFKAVVKSIVYDGVQATVSVQLAPDCYLIAKLTRNSIEDLALVLDAPVYVLFKAYAVKVLPLASSMNTSAENVFNVSVINIKNSDQYQELDLAISPDQVITCTTAINPAIQVGDKCQICIDANAVILAVLGMSQA